MRMDIVGWDPFRNPSELQQGMNQVFDSMRTQGGPAQEPSGAAAWAPPCDVCEDESEIRVIAEIPGVKMEDISLEVTADSLIIQGMRPAPESAGKQWVRVERPYGRFSRSFAISTPIDVQAVKATYGDGLLHVSIPKSDAVKPKRISVEAG